ncbi:MAG: GNAT family N-acetyltransferase [Clostridiaceae bacterium]|nr:GNAT family N-acetyltransferase [Clostridiaceae bacterium]
MEIVYKKLSKENAFQTLELFRKLKKEGTEVSFTDVVDEDEIIAWLEQSNYYIYVAERDDSVVAVFRGVRGLEDQIHSMLITIATDPCHRGKKIAHNLITYSLKDIKKREKRITLARAYVYSDNKFSISTLLGCDFTVSGTVYQHHYDKKTGKYIDDLIFHKVL